MTINRRLLVWRILDTGTRRGPASEAALLYEDISPPIPKPETRFEAVVGLRPPGTGRPTKKERRAIDDLLPDED